VDRGDINFRHPRGALLSSVALDRLKAGPRTDAGPPLKGRVRRVRIRVLHGLSGFERIKSANIR